ncbi:MAG: hypothetical protein R3Y32_07235 [Bacillota bacterium]
MIEQISVFMENKSGRLYTLTKALGDAGIDLTMMTIADTAEFGIVRIITNQNDKAIKVIKEAGFTAKTTQLIGIAVDDKPNGLSQTLLKIQECGINVEYLYSIARTEKNSALILIKVEDVKGVIEILKNAGAELITEIF